MRFLIATAQVAYANCYERDPTGAGGLGGGFPGCVGEQR